MVCEMENTKSKAIRSNLMAYDRLGVKTRAFHLGDYRRATMGPGEEVPDDYFYVNGRLPLFARSSTHAKSKYTFPQLSAEAQL